MNNSNADPVIMFLWGMVAGVAMMGIIQFTIIFLTRKYGKKEEIQDNYDSADWWKTGKNPFEV